MQVLYKTRINSPLGELLAVATGAGLITLDFLDSIERESRVLAKLKQQFADAAIKNELNAVLQDTSHWLTEYFGSLEPASPIPTHFIGTPFEQAVWEHVRTIPYGEVLTYGNIAKKLGDITLSRAVGRAVGNNPIPIIIPCHRVMGSDGHLTGYSGGIDRKKWLLAHEGYSLLF